LDLESESCVAGLGETRRTDGDDENITLWMLFKVSDPVKKVKRAGKRKIKKEGEGESTGSEKEDKSNPIP